MVVQNPDRGYTPGRWQCVGSAVLDLPAAVAARWAPGGSVVEPVDAHRSRLTIGGWSWAGIAGLFITFDTDLSNVEPPELRAAIDRVGQRLRAATTPACPLPAMSAGAGSSTDRSDEDR